MSDEVFDVVTAEGRDTGRRKLRADVHRDGDWHVSVHLWIATPDHRVLLQRRAAGKENHPGLWDVSVAGHLAAGERATDAAMRECREEIGLTIAADELRYLGTTRSEQTLNGGSYIDREIHELFLMWREVVAGTLTLDPVEVGEVALVPLEELEERVRRGDPTLVDHGGEYLFVLDVIRSSATMQRM